MLNIIDNLKINPEKIEHEFARLADLLINKCKIEMNGYSFLINELEFYYYNDNLHPDPFVHRSELQNKCGFWYFHDSGIDITFGHDNNYGGILIRSLENNKPGPWNSFKSIMEILGTISTDNNIFCIKENSNRKCEIKTKKRINLILPKVIAYSGPNLPVIPE